ncbi:hypothetical protein Ddye_020516 [Dipteronia dyeriana]|uniref:Epidermal patterning factor-like protein n=1 Tax=Dipteronia dyeriana TaxID=168575 RepID=A0AAD9U0N9_9ROSI|nr:hypothetical protein Ddye_020516 [Dipteronia dyeriana]
MMKKTTVLCYLLVVATLEIMCLVSVTSRPHSSSQSFPDQDQIPNFPGAASLSGVLEVQNKVGGVGVDGNEEERYRALGRLGSIPPSCNHKCQGCEPCEAIQVPATSDQMGLQYANYEPEGWKCKCGTFFFNP